MMHFSTMAVDRNTKLFLNVLLVTLLSIAPLTSTFTLEGSDSSFAQYPRWNPCQNGSISLEFKTALPNGLLFYADDGGRFDFFELKIIGGTVRLRANLGDGTFILVAGQNLDDDAWHKIELMRNHQETTLIVDKIAQTMKTRGKDFEFGKSSGNSDVFIGGLPISYSVKLSYLALPSVMFEPRFRGSVRNLMYKHCGHHEVRHEMMDSHGIRLNDKDLCEETNPCLNGGLCISTDEEAKCDCSKTEFEGDQCQKEKIPVVATFYGNEYLSYATQHLDSGNEELSLWFKTKRSSGMLFYSGDGSDYLNVALKDGAVVLIMNLGSGIFETQIKPDDVRFDDNAWHELRVTREAREVTIAVDGHSESGTTTGSFTMLSSDTMYLAGSPNTAQLAGSRIRSNFRGCLKKVRFQADSKVLNILDMTRDNHDFFNKHGEVLYDKCEDIVQTQPVSFTTPESNIRLPKWNAVNQGTIEFTFQTNEANGLIMYNSGVESESDVFALELLQGHLYLVMDLGSGASKWKATTKDVTDGLPHHVNLDHRGRTGTITVDGYKTEYRTKGRGGRLDLGNMLYVGGIDNNRSPRKVPKELWSAMLGYGFVGCMEDLIINKDRIDLAKIGREQGSSVAEYCRSTERQCSTKPCQHGGVCSEGWNRFVCDCSATGHIGLACDQAAITLSFDGRQYVQIAMPQESHTEAEDITVRFKTQHADGLIFSSFSDTTNDKMTLQLEKGELHLIVSLGSGTKGIHTGEHLGDDEWHTARIKRRAQKLSLSVDNGPWKKDTVQGDAYVLEFRNIDAGGMQNDQPSKHSNFIGSMQQFVFNGNHFFEMAKTGEVENIDVTAKFDDKQLPVMHPVTFRSKESYTTLPTLDIYSTFILYFQMRTVELNGLLLYSGGHGQDYFALELVDGYVNYVFNVGDGSRLLKSNNPMRINDNSWHTIVVLRPTLSQHMLKVDLFTTMYEMHSDSNSVHFDLKGSLFVGGLPNPLYYALPSLVSSLEGFQGCMSSLEVNGLNSDILLMGSLDDDSKNLVVPGCDAKQNKCEQNSCHNMGKCIQRWDSYVCDCDMTSFSGKLCREESVAYQFPASPSLITFTYPPDSRPNVNEDHLALGFTTTQDDAVLVRVESYNSNDYIEMELTNGNIFVVYNMGNALHPIGELFETVNDGEYHVVRFTRSGPNSTIQVDGSNIQSKNPSGKQHSVFNEQSKIYVGGKRNETGHIERAFRGSMAGLVFNGVRVLDLVADDDSRIQVDGNIVKTEMKRRATESFFPDIQTNLSTLSSSLTTPSLSTATTVTSDTSFVTYTELNMTVEPLSTATPEPTTPEGVTTDEFFITSGSGCGDSDDEDECTSHQLDNDAFITPTVKLIVTESWTKSSVAIKDPTSKTPVDGSGDIDDTHEISSKRPLGDSTNSVDVNRGNSPKPTGVGIEGGKERESEETTESPVSGANIALYFGIGFAIILAIILLIFVIYKVKKKSAGSYKVDESKNYPVYETPSKASSVTNGGAGKPASPAKGSETQKKDVKEWYV